jgi:hypothetical protein
LGNHPIKYIYIQGQRIIKFYCSDSVIAQHDSQKIGQNIGLLHRRKLAIARKKKAVTTESWYSSSCLKIFIALHGCDTATDDALWSGVQGGADVIVVSPCCHKEVRRQLDRHFARVKSEHPLADVLRHNIYRERIAETVTDSLRALLLELANYNVQVFEFIGGEHTGKNVMIAAVKRRRSRSEKELMALRERLRALAKMHGVQAHSLATWMGETFEQVNDAPPKRKLSMKEMPPL